MKRTIAIVAVLAAAIAVAAFLLSQPTQKDQILTFTSLGPVQIGMTVAQAEAALGVKLKDVYPERVNGCWFGNRVDGIDGRISYWIEDEKVVRIDIDEYEWPKIEKAVPPVATERGIRIASSADEVRKAYGPRLKAVLDPEGDGDPNFVYLNLLSDDKQHGLSFYIWEGKVKSFQAGTAETYYVNEPCV